MTRREDPIMKIAEYSRFRHNYLNAFLSGKATDLLVVWGWNPGQGREPSPIPHKEFVDHMKVWVVGGTACSK
jgi:hypothetical protein